MRLNGKTMAMATELLLMTVAMAQDTAVITNEYFRSVSGDSFQELSNLNNATALFKQEVVQPDSTSWITLLVLILGALSYWVTPKVASSAKQLATQLVVAASVAISGGTRRPAVKSFSKKGCMGPRTNFSLEQKLEPVKLIPQTRRTACLSNSLMPATIELPMYIADQRGQKNGRPSPTTVGCKSSPSWNDMSAPEKFVGMCRRDTTQGPRTPPSAPPIAECPIKQAGVKPRQRGGARGYVEPDWNTCPRAPKPCTGRAMDGPDVGCTPYPLHLPPAQVLFEEPSLQGYSIFTSDIFELPKASAESSAKVLVDEP